MKMKLALLTSLAAISIAVRGHDLFPLLAGATAAVKLADNGVSPKPTPPPRLDNRQDGHHNFRRSLRSLPAGVTALVAPDNICGWISANYSMPYSCLTTSTCALVLPQKLAEGRILCFDKSSQEPILFRSCYPSASLAACDARCLGDENIAKCTDRKWPYCGIVDFPNGISGWNCAVSPGSWHINTRYRGQGDARDVRTTIIPADDTSSTTSLASLSTTSPSVPEVKVSQSATALASGDGGGSKTPVGGIVGGVVGGVAAITVGFAVLFFCLRRRTRNKASQASVQSPMQPNVAPSPGIAQSYYDPKLGGSPPAPQGYVQNPQPTTPPAASLHPYSQGFDFQSHSSLPHASDPRMSYLTANTAPHVWTNPGGTSPSGQQQQQQPPSMLRAADGGDNTAQGKPYAPGTGPGALGPAPVLSQGMQEYNYGGRRHELG